MPCEKIATPKSRQKYYCLPNGISNQIAASSLIVTTYRIKNRSEHQTADARLPALIAVDRLIDALVHLFTTHRGTPKVRKTTIDQLTSMINRAIGEMAKGHVSALRVDFPIGGDLATYGLRNIKAGNEPVLTCSVTMNGRVSERYSQGGTL